jgi:ABC-type nitrate/sulfonate/bicarbonate transport system substrate-binding protein
MVVLVLICAFGLSPCLAAERKVKIAQFPIGPAYWNFLNMKDQGIYKKWGDKIGVEYAVSSPQDDFAAFMGRSVDVASFAPLELTRLKAAEGKHVVIFGRYITNTIGWYVRGDSTAKTPADLTGKKLGIPGWDTAAAQVAEVIFKELWGLNMKKDFQVHIGPWPALPKLLAKGEVDLCFSLMPLTLKPWMEGKIKPIWETVGIEYAKHSNGYMSGVQFFCGWKDWLDKNEDVASNLLSAYQEGIDYTYANTNEWLKKYMPTAVKDLTDEQVRFTAKHYLNSEFLYKNVYLEQSYLDQEVKFLKKAEALGILPKGSVTMDIFRLIR